MDNDAVAFGAMCLVTRDTFPLPEPRWAAVAAGALLCVAGVGVKVWAKLSLAEGGYLWRNFFLPREHERVSARGPYRWFANPMYTVGYAHAYGFALALGSAPGLAGAAFAQAAILLLNALVETPQVERMEHDA
jgi:protein-S-isoprenylcysteine O-methyltransferase Ste14